MDTSDIGNRMKEYEKVSRNFLVRRTPVAIRLDMRAGHTFTKGFRKPFDEYFTSAMEATMLQLCENIQGCIFGYTQSDEITLILQDYKTIKTDAWFEYNVQKLTSISASMATLYFNRAFHSNVMEYNEQFYYNRDVHIEDERYYDALNSALENGAVFDSRAFNIPKEEVTNLIYWRQLDAMRNSVLSVGQAHYSHRTLENKSCKDIKEMLIADGMPWEDITIADQHGRACYHDEEINWVIDEAMPILKGEDREYLEKYI